MRSIVTIASKSPPRGVRWKPGLVPCDVRHCHRRAHTRSLFTILPPFKAPRCLGRLLRHLALHFADGFERCDAFAGGGLELDSKVRRIVGDQC